MNSEDAALALKWLLRHPQEYHTILSLARLENPEDYDYAEFGEGEREYAERFIGSSRVAHCSKCYFPIVLLADGRRRDWPSMDQHKHGKPQRLRNTSVAVAPTKGRVIE